MLSPRLIRAAWLTGELSYKLRNIQKKIRQEWLGYCAGIKYYFECTRRLGKSTLLLILLSEFAIKHPGSKCAFYAPVKEGLKDYIEPIYEKVFADCPGDLKPKLDSTLTLKFSNGSRVIFRGSNMKQYRIRRGNDLNIAGIDEGRDVDDLDTLIDSVVIPSLFTGSGKLIISSTPADTDDHPLRAYQQAAELEGWLSKYDIMDANRYDPEDFPLERIQTWEKETKDKVAWKREYLALWVKDPNKTVIPEWDDVNARAMVHDEYFPWYHKYAALDSGVKDKTAALLAYYDFRQAKLIVEDEFALKDAEVRTDRIAELVKAKEAALLYQKIHDKKDSRYADLPYNEKVYRRVADNNNLILVNDLNSLYALDFYPTRKDELAAMINLCREWAKDGRIIVSPRCVELLGCLRNAIWNKDKTELARSKVYGHFDALMALVYLVRNVDTATNPIPKYFGKSAATHAGVPVNANEPQTASATMARVFRTKTSRDKAREDFARGNI